MVATTDTLLGIGLYTPAEAAFYARVRPQLLMRWLFGGAASRAVLQPELAGEDRLVTFLDFVQTLAVRAIRTQHRIPLDRIRDAMETARQRYGVSHPFAMRHTTYLYEGQVLLQVGEDELVQISGAHKHNLVIPKVVEIYMKDLTFGADGLATAYAAYRWRDQAICMDPQVRFGEPLVSSCGYSARTLWEAVQSEGDEERAARAYGVKPEEVEIACRYFDQLRGSASG